MDAPLAQPFTYDDGKASSINTEHDRFVQAACCCATSTLLRAVLKDEKVLTMGEVGVLLDEYATGTKQRDPEYQPHSMLLKAVEYSQRFASNKNKETLQKIREWVPFLAGNVMYC